MKKMIFPAITLLFSIAACQKGADEYECRQRWNSLSESRDPVGLSINDQYRPRILDERAWFVGPQSKLTGIHLTDNSVKVVPPSSKVRIGNARQHKETYTATDCTSLLRFNTSSNVWENLFTAPSGYQFDYDDELEIMHGLIPFLLEPETVPIKVIYVHQLSGNQTRPLESLSTLLRDSSFRICTQPKVFVREDTLLAFIIRRLDNSLRPYEIFSFNLSKNKMQARTPLSMQNYQDATIINETLAAHSSGGFYSESLSVVNPWNGAILWEDFTGDWLIYDNNLLSASSLGFSMSKQNPANNETIFQLPFGLQFWSMGGIYKGQYCFIGKQDPAVSSGSFNQIVLVDAQTGCETMREPLPSRVSLVGKVICSEAHNLLIVMDETGFVHFLTPKEM